MNSTVLAVLCFTKMTEGGFKRKGGDANHYFRRRMEIMCLKASDGIGELILYTVSEYGNGSSTGSAWF